VASKTQAQQIRVLVIDDHAGMRDGISAMLNAQPDMKVAGVASDGREAIERFKELQPDVSLVDWNLPIVRGEEVIATLGKEFPEARFIVITALNNDDCIQRAKSLGARAYIPKDMLRRELLGTIRAVHQGQQHFPEKIINRLKGDG
jgi:two-component system, NarL family, response regulator